MKLLLNWSLVLLTTFLVGYGAVLAWKWILDFENEAGRFDPQGVRAVENDTIEKASLPFDSPPAFDPNIDYQKTGNVKLLRTGAFYADEVPFKSGETWLGLIRCGDGSYELRRTKVFIESTHNDGPHDRLVITSNRCESVFLLGGTTGLTLGDVETQFDRNALGETYTNNGTYSNDEFGYFVGSTPKGFGNGRGMFWKLWVENPSPEGFLQKNSALLLSHSGGSPQLLRTLPEGCDDCGWSVEWVGDLDRDRKLDFLINISRHYNSYEPTLFLSSKGYQVFASFHGVGC